MNTSSSVVRQVAVKGSPKEYERVYRLELENRNAYICKYDELPEWQGDNVYIRDGYVRETKSFEICWKSLFFLSNKLINIHSHFLPSILDFLPMILYTNLSLPLILVELNEIPIGGYLVGSSISLILSSCFYFLKQHSKEQATTWSKFDYLGIINLFSC